MESAAAVTRALISVEAAAIQHDWIRTRLDEYDHNVRVDYLSGAILPAEYYYKAQRLRELIRGQVFGALQKVDVLALPSSSEAAPFFRKSLA